MCVFRDGGAVELDENAVAAQAFGMDGAGDEFLAGARLAVDEDAAVGGRHEANLLAQRLEGHAFAGEHGGHAELALELLVFGAQAARFDGVLDDDEGAIEGERLLEKVVGAELGGLDGGLDGAVAADDDDLRPGLGGELANVGEHFESVAIGEPDVEQDHVVGRVLKQHQRLGRGGGAGDAVALFAENLFERGANLRFVVDDQDVVHEGSPFAAVSASGVDGTG